MVDEVLICLSSDNLAQTWRKNKKQKQKNKKIKQRRQNCFPLKSLPLGIDLIKMTKDMPSTKETVRMMVSLMLLNLLSMLFLTSKTGGAFTTLCTSISLALGRAKITQKGYFDQSLGHSE